MGHVSRHPLGFFPPASLRPSPSRIGGFPSSGILGRPGRGSCGHRPHQEAQVEAPAASSCRRKFRCEKNLWALFFFLNQTFSNFSVRRRCCHGGPDPRRSLRRAEEILRKSREVRQLKNEVTQTKRGSKKAWESAGGKKIKFSSRRRIARWGERRSNGRQGIKFANVIGLFSFSWEEEDRRKLQAGERSQGGTRTTNFLVIGGDSGRVLQSLLNSRSHSRNGKGGTGRNWLIVTGGEEGASADLVSQCECRKIYWRMP